MSSHEAIHRNGELHLDLWHHDDIVLEKHRTGFQLMHGYERKKLAEDGGHLIVEWQGDLLLHGDIGNGRSFDNRR
ncbi:hypothetical protein SS05631_b50700 (plasmid) [Sinorhizobium sp. CCBAU 05631]|nr:hypothetical protein SS05631_b50700 [Sinorhizobium sp. CCBAU 05631]